MEKKKKTKNFLIKIYKGDIIKMKKENIYKILLIIIIFVQICVSLYIGNKKEYYHMDEAYSYGLMNYHTLSITDDKDFLDKWHTKDYFLDYFSVNSDEISDFKAVYENQKNDVHPPLYYLLLRISSLFTIDTFSKWTGIGLNIIILIIATVFVYIISSKLFKSKALAILTTIINAFSMATLENTIYIRMYALSTLNILIFTYINMKIFDKKQIKINDMILLRTITYFRWLNSLLFLYICSSNLYCPFN